MNNAIMNNAIMNNAIMNNTKMINTIINNRYNVLKQVTYILHSVCAIFFVN
jgi:hypothetical protein